MPIPRTQSSIARSLLRDDVHSRLRDAIVAGDLAPGEQLRDVELADRLGVSRTPVREALLRLAQAGLVVTLPGRATYVSPLDPAAVRQARDVVAGLHAVAVRSAVPVMTEADVAEMREAGERFRSAMLAGDIAAAVVADDDLHGVPVRLAGNALLEAVLDQHTPILRRAERLGLAGSSFTGSIDLHDRLIEHCADGKVQRAVVVAFETWNILEITEPTPDGAPPVPSARTPRA